MIVRGGVVQDAQGESRFWSVDAGRAVRWWGSGGEDGTPLPVPGASPVLAVDSFPPVLALLADGEAWRFEVRGNPPQWRRHMNLMTQEAGMVSMSKRSNDGPAPEPVLVTASVERYERQRRIVAVHRDRRVLVLQEDSQPAPVGPGPIPGTAAILAVKVDGAGSTALLADGTVLASTVRGWSMIGHVGPESAAAVGADITTRLVSKANFKLTADRGVQRGEVFEAPAERARELIRTGRADPAPPEPVQDSAR